MTKEEFLKLINGDNSLLDNFKKKYHEILYKVGGSKYENNIRNWIKEDDVYLSSTIIEMMIKYKDKWDEDEIKFEQFFKVITINLLK